MNWKSFKDNPPKQINSGPSHINNVCHTKGAEYIFDIYVETKDSKCRRTVPISYSTKIGWFMPGTFNPVNYESESLTAVFGDKIEILYWDYFPCPKHEETVKRNNER